MKINTKVMAGGMRCDKMKKYLYLRYKRKIYEVLKEINKISFMQELSRSYYIRRKNHSLLLSFATQATK